MENNFLDLFSRLFMGQSNNQQNTSSIYPNSSYPNAPYGQNSFGVSQNNDMSSMMPLLLSLMGGGGVSALSKSLPEPLATLLTSQTKNSPQSGEQSEKAMPHDEVIL